MSFDFDAAKAYKPQEKVFVSEPTTLLPKPAQLTQASSMMAVKKSSSSSLPASPNFATLQRVLSLPLTNMEEPGNT